jgi:hypothetical protein
MSAIIKSEMISRRKALSLMGLAAAFWLAAVPAVLKVSDAEAQTTAAPTTAAPTAVAPTAGMERRAARHERRMERRTARHERRQERRTGTATGTGTTTGAATTTGTGTGEKK